MEGNLIDILKDFKSDKKDINNNLNLDIIHSSSQHSLLVPNNQDCPKILPLPFLEFPNSKDSPFHDEFKKLTEHLVDVKSLPIFKKLFTENKITFDTRLCDIMSIEDLSLIYEIEQTPTIGENGMLTSSTIKKRTDTSNNELIKKEDLINLLTKNTYNDGNTNIHDYSSILSNNDFIEKVGEYYDKIAVKSDENVDKTMNKVVSNPEIPINIDENYSKACELVSKSTVIMSNKSTGNEDVYFKMIDIKKDMEEFEKLRNSMVIKFPFELDDFQKQAILMIEKQENVLVAAHTSAGKTVVAEYAIASANEIGKKSIYTSPIKALSNQKFYEFKRKFKDVGIVTGDVKINDTAQIVIMTTEILRSMLYRGGNDANLTNVRYVIFDEVHYLNDDERGVVWEELFIMLPKHIKLILLSATIPNCHQVANWIGKIREQMINVILTFKRPVPLEHFFYYGKDFRTRKNCLNIIDTNGNFITSNFLRIKNELSALEDKNTKTSFFDPNEKQRYLNLIQYLKEENKLPTIIFVFSRDRCFKLAVSFHSLDLTTAQEKFLISSFFKNSISRLSPANQNMDQVKWMENVCIRGLAVHHSGVLPILREIVELLFHKGFIKVLLATETFAMGVNMPAKSVVFSSLSKHSNNGLRDLLASEYIQMAGRAGRRGQDSIGSVYVVIVKETPAQSTFLEMATGKPLQITSKFKLTYGMILNLLASSKGTNHKAEHMMQSSFSEYIQHLSAKDSQKKLDESTKALEERQNFISSCVHCSKDLIKYSEACVAYFNIWGRVLSYVTSSTNLLKNIFCPGRLVLISTDSLGYYRPAVIVDIPKTISSSHQQSHTLSHIEIPMIFLSKKDDKSLKYMFDSISNWPVIIDHKPGPPSDKDVIETAYYYDICINKVVYVFAQKLKCNMKNILNSRPSRTPNLLPVGDNPDIKKLVSFIDQITQNIVENKYNFFNLEKYEINPSKNTEDYEYIQDILNKFNQACSYMSQSNFDCINCPTLQEHCSTLLLLKNMNNEIEKLKSEISDGNLIHMPEYFKRLKVLQKLNLIDSNNNITLKGKVGLKFTCECEIVLVELLFNGTVKSLTPPQLAALLSCLVERNKSNKKNDELSNIVPVLRDVYNKVEDVTLMIEQLEIETDLSTSERVCDPKLMEGIYDWAQGATFNSIVKTSNVQEGISLYFNPRMFYILND